MALLKALLLPPSSLLLLAFAGLFVIRRRFRLGAGLITIALGLLYLCSTTLFANWALSVLSPDYLDPRAAQAQAQAIVVLGGGTDGFAPEYAGDRVSSLTLSRVRYAARLFNLPGRPILVSGGSVSGETTPEAAQMRALLEEELRVPVRWVEDRSRNTLENALETRRLLAPLGIRTVYLVTHAWHVPRARLAFEHAGFVVVPAPTAFSSVDGIGVHDFVPRASALSSSYYFFHEMIGNAWYRIRIRWTALGDPA